MIVVGGETGELPVTKGVFEHLIGVAAFNDRVTVGVDGNRRRRPLPSVRMNTSIPIGGPGRPYARSIHGTCMGTGNPFELRYGANRLFSNLPTSSLRFRSDVCPVTEDELIHVATGIFCAGFRMRPTLVELTFDLMGPSVKDLRNSAVTSFRREHELRDENGRSTYYAGGPNSGVQVRVYDKAVGVVRVEFVFRSSYLRSRGISEIHGIEALRSVEISRWIRFCSLKSNGGIERKLHGVPPGWRRRNLINWPLRWPLNIWASTVRHFGVDPQEHLRTAAVHRQMLAMQKCLVW
jgi:hypothetical protein